MILTMKSQAVRTNFLHTLGGYYLIPHELLHVLAYRLLGKPCHYEWGDYRVTSPAQITQGEKLFILLLPVGVCLTLSLFFHLIWIVLALSAQMPLTDYIFSIPGWHFIFHVLANFWMLYSGTAYRDVRQVIQLLFGQKKPKQNSYKAHQ